MQGQRRRWTTVLLTPGWIAVHIALVAVVAGFLGLGWWQVNRAASGNLLSYGYAFEWPAFAAFAIWAWVVEIRKALRAPDGTADAESGAAERTGDEGATAEPKAPQRRRRARSEAAYDDSDDPQLAAYNHYLAWLNANPHLTPADYPGLPTKENA